MPSPMNSIWPKWNENRLFTVLLTLVFVALTSVLLVKTWNAFSLHAVIGKAPTSRDVITIDGEGKVSGKPTLAEIDVGLYTEGTEVPAAQADNTNKVNVITRAMKDLGVADADIQTNNYSIYPRYDYKDGKQSVIGYSVSQNVHLKIRDLSKIGNALSLAAQSGANQINGVNFTIDDPTQLKQEARKKALEDARNKAEELAKALHLDVSRVVTFSESSVNPVPAPYNYRADAAVSSAAPAAPDIQPGSLDILSHVSVTFEIR